LSSSSSSSAALAPPSFFQADKHEIVINYGKDPRIGSSRIVFEGRFGGKQVAIKVKSICKMEEANNLIEKELKTLSVVQQLKEGTDAALYFVDFVVFARFEPETAKKKFPFGLSMTGSPVEVSRSSFRANPHCSMMQFPSFCLCWVLQRVSTSFTRTELPIVILNQETSLFALKKSGSFLILEFQETSLMNLLTETVLPAIIPLRQIVSTRILTIMPSGTFFPLLFL